MAVRSLMRDEPRSRSRVLVCARKSSVAQYLLPFKVTRVVTNSPRLTQLKTVALKTSWAEAGEAETERG